MRRSRHEAGACRALVATAILAALSLPLAVAGAPASPLEGWSVLRLEGRKYLVASGRAEIGRHATPCPPGRVLVTVESTARVFGARAGEHLAASVLDAGRDAATMRFVERSGERKARFGTIETDPRRLTIRTFRPPADGDAEGEDHAWAETKHEVFDLEAHDGAGPVDAFGLLARLGVLTREPSGTVQVLTKRGPGLLGFRRVGREAASLRVRNLDDGDRLRGELELVIVDLYPAGGGEDATVLNMRGATRLWIDPQSGALVRIEGEHEGAGGRLTMRLTGAQFDEPALPDVRWPGAADRGACGEVVEPGRALDGMGGAS